MGTTIDSPGYQEGQTVYLRESAALGFVEAVRISGIYRKNGVWMYTFESGPKDPTPGAYGDRRSWTNGAILYLSEDELVPQCEAYRMAEAQAKAHYDRMRALRQASCGPDIPAG